MSEYAGRLAALRLKLADQGLDGLVITHPTNRRYLTGFTANDIPPNESAGHLLVNADTAVLVTGSVNVTQAEAQAPHVEVLKREKSWAVHDAGFITETGMRRVGYEPNAMLEGVFRGINEQLVEKGYRVEWVDADRLVEELRIVKSPAEIELLRRAFDITCQAFNEVARAIEPGMTEIQVARRLHDAMIELGAEGPAFPIIVASGPHAARPHHEPGTREIQPGEPIVIDMGAKYEGYCADLTRTVWIGEADARLAEIYGLVHGANDAVIERAHPGATGKELDGYARDFIESGGYGEEFSHGLGHGVGLRVHEAPSASKTAENEIAAGHTLTVEPGIYLPEWGGVRIEDVLLFTEDGFEILTLSAEKLPAPSKARGGVHAR
jgi:Xaa-Pro aminopeptidase